MLPFYTYIALVAACFLAYLLNMRQLRLLSYVMVPLMGLTLLAELLDHYGVITRAEKTNGYQIFELLLLSSLYFCVFKKRWIKASIAIAVAIYFLITIVLSVSYGLEAVNLISMSFSHLIMIACSLYYLRKLYEPPFETKSVLAQPIAWVSFGNLLYFVGMFLFLGAKAIISEDSWDAQDVLILLNMIINYAMYIVYFFGAICQRIFK